MGHPYCSSTQLNRYFARPLFFLSLLMLGTWSFLATANNASAQTESFQAFTTLSPLDGYQLGEPFTLKTAITCLAEECPADIIIELSPEITYIRAVSTTPAKVRYSLADRQVTLTPTYLANTKDYQFELQLSINEPVAGQQPELRLGQFIGGEIDWQESIFISAAPPLFPNQDSAVLNQPLYLQNRLQTSPSNRLTYAIAAANRSASQLDTVTLVTTFPTGAVPVEIASGWFIQQSNREPLPDLIISYQTESGDSWEDWGMFQNPIKDQQAVLSNPLLTTGTNLTETVPISMKAIKIEIENVPAGFRWGDDQSSQLNMQLTIDPDLEAEWLEVCTISSFTLVTDSEPQTNEVCSSARTPVQAQPTADFDFWVEVTEENPGSPQPGDQLQINPRLAISAPFSLTQTAIDLVVELPRWLALVNTMIEPSSGVQPTFNQSISAVNGQVQLHWQWPENSSIISLTLPTIEAEVQSGVPTGVQTFPLYLITNGPQSCWGERPFGRDTQDIDQDSENNEFICRTEAEIGVQPVAGFAADLRIVGQPAFGLPMTTDFDLINGGNQPINQINTAIRLPANWLIAPPEVPAGVAVFYSTANPDLLCEGAAECPAANWQIEQPAELSTVSAVLLTGTFKPLGPSDRATVRFHLLPQPAQQIEPLPSTAITETLTTTQTLDQLADVIWPSILINGATINDEAIGFQFQPSPVTLAQAPTVAPIQGRAWLDANENGKLDGTEQAQGNVPLALISPGGDGEPATADDRIINWSRTDADGFYRFGEALPGSYYIALPETAQGYFPTQLLQTDGSETDTLTAFNPITWRTETFAIFQGETAERKNLSLATPDRPTLVGTIALDKNQNGVWDDPVSAGVNGVKVILVGLDGEEIAETTSKTNGFGQPGHFVLPQPNGFLPTDLILRLTTSVPFVGGTITESGETQIEFDIGDNTVFNALVEAPPQGVDSGDAPASYGIALHPITPDTTLGLISDGDELESGAEIDDDNDQLDDEEGIFFADGGIGTTADAKSEVIIVLRNQQELNQRLNGWIDFDGDGRFSESERIIEDFQPIPQNNPQAERFTYTIPPESACGATFARFRLGQADGSPEGTDESGEVEDISYQIECVTDLAVTLGPQTTPMGPNEISHWFLTVHNRGSSTAENVAFNVTIPSPVNYQGVVSLTNDPLACSDNETARTVEAVECQIAELAPGQGITLSLAYLLPFDTQARSVSSIASVSADTADSNLNNNLVNRSIKVEKQWVLQDASYEAFTHVSFFSGIVTIPDNQQLDFKLDTTISTAINVPISISIGVDTNRLPRLTVPACIDSPEDVTCNQTNIIEGQILQENYGIERIFFEDDLIYEPENVQIVRLNRISDPNLTRCGQSNSCVGYDLFRVGRGEIYPYAWTAPFDYFYMGFFTSGGRQVDCPETGYENRCFIVQDAKPGNYDVEGFATINLVFDDTRLGNQPVIVERFIKFRTRIRVVAPFVEPESRGDN
ncbi:MAG: SdrD B-like domain-containing protein [Anaerolineae bacterium]